MTYECKKKKILSIRMKAEQGNMIMALIHGRFDAARPMENYTEI